MQEIYYKISEISEILGVEQYTLRYLENSLGLKIKRNERGDRLYSESDLETLKLVLQLKNKGLNTTAIKMALENIEETEEKALSPLENKGQGMMEVVTMAKKIVEQNQTLLEQNRKLEQRMEKLEQKIDKRNLERERKIDEFLELWKTEQARGKSWLSRILSK
ncbi:MAG: MerR family transcriptional regulator [Syntrophomonas sp.]|uniref:MerR family transcriptional regulator n=1 Tax=Syntrophomonas sp. TaxID=2053627 RepID=UPI002637EDDE|nr:MerR family transcriptional regulator [Syntrophomonas sp.]MDD2511004.1 MerR family transcriptional regulator [Syntrophomonas sp.]MDD3878904.1 MerR family transcriptional regulator [Syntrophomonas sp.]MDD4626877.1 MerR family transcriptional regulator [Syntrophomonas sp.]